MPEGQEDDRLQHRVRRLLDPVVVNVLETAGATDAPNDQPAGEPNDQQTEGVTNGPAEEAIHMPDGLAASDVKG